jgi:CspA family cold shock protein
VADGRRGPQALAVRVVEAPASLAASSRAATDNLASIIEDSIKIFDRVGNNIRRGKYPTPVEAERLGKVLRGIAQQIENNA